MSNFNELNYPGTDSVAVKHISYSHNLFFNDELSRKDIKIDDSLWIINGSKEKNGRNFLINFIKQKTRSIRISGSYFLYIYSGKRKNRFEAEDCVRRFLTAVRIYKNKNCDSDIYFSIEDSLKKKYYKPYDLRKDVLGFYDRNSSTISSRKELNTIKKIYKNLDEVKINDHLHYSKLHNAITFFNHSYDEHWTLLKTTLFFTSLESLFSDSQRSELTYKIALRTSYFLHPKDSEKRKEVFNFIKMGYEIRSYFVHGSNSEERINKLMKKYQIKKKVDWYGFHHHFIEDLQEIVVSCLRKILLDKKYIGFFAYDKKDKEVNDFFDNLVM